MSYRLYCWHCGTQAADTGGLLKPCTGCGGHKFVDRAGNVGKENTIAFFTPESSAGRAINAQGMDALRVLLDED